MHLNKIKCYQTGVSLIELMVGLVIGLLATLVIMQVFSVFEGQKRTTSGSADAQTNGSIAMMNIQRSVQMAGYGLSMPMADTENSSLKCTPFANFQLDPADPTSTINLFPIEIQDGGGNANDTIVARYSTSAKGAVPVEITQVTGNTLNVKNVIGCGAEMTTAAYNALYPAERPNIVLITRGTTCGMAFINQQPIQGAIGTDSTIVISAAPDVFTAAGTPIKAEDKLTCMGNWASHTFSVDSNANELLRNQQAIISGVVGLQAQYGVSASATDNNVNNWVDATGIWANPSVANRNRIKAIRFSVVLRNGLRERDIVTTAAPQAWVNSGTATTAINVSALPDWQNYRYRVFSTTVPLRNMLWSREAM